MSVVYKNVIATLKFNNNKNIATMKKIELTKEAH